LQQSHRKSIIPTQVSEQQNEQAEIKRDAISTSTGNDAITKQLQEVMAQSGINLNKKEAYNIE